MYLSLQQKLFSANFRELLEAVRKLASEIMVDKDTDEIDIFNQLTNN